jgi:hypothetical protein
MRWAVTMSLGVALLAGAAGCKNPCDHVEAELRARESDVRELREELERREFLTQAMERELRAIKGLPGPDGHVETPRDPFPVRTLVLGRQTGGHAGDNCAGDDGLDVLLEPRDCDGQAIKAPGFLTVEAMEITPAGLKRPLSAWDISIDQLRCSWRNGLFSTGYSLSLPWKEWPTTEKLRVVAHFRLLDGRVFEADKDVTIRLAPAPLRRTAPAPEPPPPDPPPSSEPPPRQMLPPPKPVPPDNGPVLELQAKRRLPPLPLAPAPPVVVPAVEVLRPQMYGPGE